MYKIKKNTNELEENYKIRKKFIEYLNPKNKKELILYTNYSNILINIIYLGNKYERNKMEIISNILKSKNNKVFREVLKYII
tara:strand:+ start:411 stop:656 length:246 start_codon:yes stop_codon:yes gene_type:complete